MDVLQIWTQPLPPIQVVKDSSIQTIQDFFLKIP